MGILPLFPFFSLRFVVLVVVVQTTDISPMYQITLTLFLAKSPGFVSLHICVLPPKCFKHFLL